MIVALRHNIACARRCNPFRAICRSGSLAIINHNPKGIESFSPGLIAKGDLPWVVANEVHTTLKRLSCKSSGNKWRSPGFFVTNQGVEDGQ